MTRFRRSSRLASLLAGLATTVLASTAFAQGAVITGTVRSQQGQPLQGAQIRIADLNVAVGTGDDGTYRITLAADRLRGQTVALSIRSIGFKPISRNITLNTGNQTQDFQLEVDINRLSEVVVTGVTGATETRKLAFTVDKVDQANLPVPAASALQSLQGKVTGAQVITPSGRPGSSPSILLRGAKSLNLGLSPLVVVDGIIMNGGLNDINPQDIESIEVVKGAAAASTYGSRAQNGVIQITTKSGATAGQGARFSVRSETGVQDVQSAYPFSQRHWLIMDEQRQNFCVQESNQPACSRTVNFEDYALYINDNGDEVQARLPVNFERDAGIGRAMSKPNLKGVFQVDQWPVRYNPIAAATTTNLYTNNNVDMSGRFGNTGFFASASNLIQQGAIKFLDGYRRNTARLNVDQAVGEDLTMQLTTLYARTATFPQTDFFVLTRVPAGIDLLRRDSRGRLFIRSNPLNQGQQNENPLWDAENLVNRSDVDRYLGSFTTRYTPYAWLDFDANASMDRRRDDSFTLREKGYRVTRTNQSNVYLGTYAEGSGADAAYNFSLNGTARQNNPLGIADLQTRINARYSFERDDGSGFSAGGNTLAVPGLLTLDNVVVPNSPNSGNRTSVRAIGMLGGIAVDYKGKYIFDAVYRRDGSSLFGAAERWHPYGRGSAAWRISDEGWWPFKGAVNDMKFRYSVGTAGGRPGFDYQYETFNIGSGGTVSSNQLGNRFLKPENTTETEVGFDAELFSKYGLNVTYARDITRDQMLEVPSSASSGFSTQWRNAGTVENKTYEVSLNVPVITNRDVVWTTRLAYDRNRAFITELGVPPFAQTTSSSRFEFRVGERLGNIYGKYFIQDCSEIDSHFRSQCGGPGSQFQRNDHGYIVWTGGLLPTEGITRNAWQAYLPGCLDSNGDAIGQTGRKNCEANDGTVNNPWGIPLVSWGMLMTMRDSLTGSPIQHKLGNTQPDFHLSMSHNLNWKRLTLYALVDGNYGNRLFNQQIAWSLGDYQVRYEDQDGKSVENAKPMGYYWRAPQPEHGSGVGGMYDVLGSNNQTVQKGTYTKLREVSVSYQLGAVRGIGDFSLTLIGRNLYTFTDFLGWDPETGGSVLGSSAFGAVAGTGDYPQTRTFTFTIGTRF